jgi:hypothetical protein
MSSGGKPKVNNSKCVKTAINLVDIDIESTVTELSNLVLGKSL